MTPDGLMGDVMTETPLLLTTAQVATLTNHGRTKIFELIKAGEIKSVRVGRARLVPRADLEDYVERLRAAAA
jgi:excisionase family DNA binding protein